MHKFVYVYGENAATEF